MRISLPVASLKRKLFACAAMLTLAAGAAAQVSVGQAWIRATVPQQTSTGVFMRLSAPGGARLLGASSPVAGSAEIHSMKMQGTVMRMQAVEGIDLPPGKQIDLASGGYHIMLLDLKRQLKAGDTVPVSLALRDQNGKSARLTFEVPVKPLTYVAP